MPVIDIGSVVGPAGATGATGATGPQGIQGNPGPNQVTANTSTTLNGILKGDGNSVSTATVDSTPNSSHANNLISSAAVADALAEEILYFTGLAVSAAATSQVICTVSNAAITADHVLLDAEFATPQNILTPLAWVTTAGQLTLSGRCSAATTVNVKLGKKGN